MKFYLFLISNIFPLEVKLSINITISTQTIKYLTPVSSSRWNISLLSTFTIYSPLTSAALNKSVILILL